MKTWIVTVFGLIIFILLSLCNQSLLEKTTRRLAGKLHRVDQAIQMKKWREAGRELKSIQKNWGQIKPSWSLLLHHREIDAIDQALVRTEKAVQSQDFPTALVEQGNLTNDVEHIPKREQFSLVNVL